MALLEVQELSIRYGRDDVVADLTFAIDRGESLGIAGTSGAGKTQTAMALLGLLPASAEVGGDIRLDGTSLVGLTEPELNSLRATKIAMVFQDPSLALNPYVRVGQQLSRILLEHGLADANGARDRAVAMLERVGLVDPKRQYRAFPHELSGGMRQRVMIAAALIAEPDLLVADEPTTALDVTVQSQILSLLESLRDDTALMLVTHDLGVIANHCERMLVMQSGRAVERGTTRSLFVSPQHEHTRALVASAPRLGGRSPPQAFEADAALDVQGLTVRYGDALAVDSANLSLRRGETLSLVGESGSGKTSLARALLGLVDASAGTIRLSGRSLKRSTPAGRRAMSLVFQNPQASLDPQQTVRQALKNAFVDAGRPTGADVLREALERVGLGEDYLGRYPHQLSGGQAQRVAIARATASEPELLVCDEAVSALDGQVRDQVLDLLRELQQDTGLSILFISHDLAVVEAISHRVAVMYAGRIVERGPATAVFSEPAHPYTQALLKSVPSPDPLSSTSYVLEGEPPSPIDPPLGCAFHPRCEHAVARCRVERPKLRLMASVEVACHRSEELMARATASETGA